jgi:hypothetical protein
MTATRTLGPASIRPPVLQDRGLHRRDGEAVRTDPAPHPDRWEVGAEHRAAAERRPAGLGLPAAIVGIGMLRPKRPVLGMDAAGVVETVRANVTVSPRDEVITMLGANFGSHDAEREAGALPVPRRRPHDLSGWAAPEPHRPAGGCPGRRRGVPRSCRIVVCIAETARR